MKKLSWYHLILPFLGFLGFMIFILPEEASMSASLGLEESPDTSIYYTGEKLYEIAESYGETGRAFYVEQRFTFDLIWPMAYGLFLMVTIAYGVQHVEKKSYKKLLWLPIVAVIMDYLENMMTATVMIRYPAQTPIISSLAGVFTGFKWLTLSLAFMVMIIVYVMVLYQKMKIRRTAI